MGLNFSNFKDKEKQIPEEFKKESSTNSQKFCLNETIIFILKMLAPITPHICEDLWNKFYGEEDIELSWPDFDEDIILIEEFELIIQINGKVRGLSLIHI